MPNQQTYQYTTIKEYFEEHPRAAIIFTLHNFRGEEIEAQLLLPEELMKPTSGGIVAKFKVTEELSARMIPGTYTLYIYIGILKENIPTNAKPFKVKDFILNKCLSEKGVEIQVRGGLKRSTIGGNN